MARHMLLVLSNSLEGQEEQFNDWYTNQHLGDVLKVPGFVAAQRFELSPEQLRGAGPYRYCAIYEVETDDLAATGKALTGARDMPISPALDGANTSAWFFSPITGRVEAGS